MATALASIPIIATTVNYSNVDSAVFYRAISEAKNHGKEEEVRQGIAGTVQSKWYGACVHVYSINEYHDMQRVLFDEGRTGFALKDRDIVSVFKHPACTLRPALSVVIPTAVQLGGNRLDCFNRGLPSTYAKFGFLPVARIRFEVQYAPQDWNYARDQHPDIIYMVYKREIAEKRWESDTERDGQIEAVISQLSYSTNEDALSIQRRSCMM